MAEVGFTVLQVSLKAICLFGVQGFKYSIDLKEFAGRDGRNPQQLELLLVDVLSPCILF